jgi:hypothetical protein
VARDFAQWEPVAVHAREASAFLHKCLNCKLATQLAIVFIYKTSRSLLFKPSLALVGSKSWSRPLPAWMMLDLNLSDRIETLLASVDPTKVCRRAPKAILQPLLKIAKDAHASQHELLSANSWPGPAIEPPRVNSRKWSGFKKRQAWEKQYAEAGLAPSEYASPLLGLPKELRTMIVREVVAGMGVQLWLDDRKLRGSICITGQNHCRAVIYDPHSPEAYAHESSQSCYKIGLGVMGLLRSCKRL